MIILFTPIIYNNTNFHIYKIDENGNVKKNDVLLSNDKIIYNSTNGYDYVLLEQFDGTSTLCPLDQVLYNSFNTITIWPKFKCIHLNGELRDNRLHNLHAVEDIEEWKTVCEPTCIKPNTWKISSFGRLINTTTNMIVDGCNRRGYTIDCFSKANCTGIKHVLRHRTVCSHFVDNPNSTIYTCVNHIDGNKANNHYMNLEWVDYSINNKHAILIGLSPHGTKISDEDVDMIIEMLMDPRFLYNPSVIYKYLDHDQFPYITIPVIQNIKQKSSTYIRKNSRYDLSSIVFNEAIHLPELKITDDEFDMIIEMLMDGKYHYSPSIIYNAIDKTAHPNITKTLISLIKQKKISMLHSKKYTINDLDLPEAGPPTYEIDMVIDMLLDEKFDGRVLDIYNAIDHKLYPNISQSMIYHIKQKHPAYIRSDSKYDLMSLEFKRHINKSV